MTDEELEKQILNVLTTFNDFVKVRELVKVCKKYTEAAVFNSCGAR